MSESLVISHISIMHLNTYFELLEYAMHSLCCLLKLIQCVNINISIDVEW